MCCVPVHTARNICISLHQLHTITAHTHTHDHVKRDTLNHTRHSQLNGSTRHSHRYQIQIYANELLILMLITFRDEIGYLDANEIETKNILIEHWVNSLSISN